MSSLFHFSNSLYCNGRWSLVKKVVLIRGAPSGHFIYRALVSHVYMKRTVTNAATMESAPALAVPGSGVVSSGDSVGSTGDWVGGMVVVTASVVAADTEAAVTTSTPSLTSPVFTSATKVSPPRVAVRAAASASGTVYSTSTLLAVLASSLSIRRAGPVYLMPMLSLSTLVRL